MKRFVVFALFILASCGVPLVSAPTPTPTCQAQAAPFLAQIEPIAREWDDANALAGQTPRAALAQQIEALQAIRRKTEDLKAPDCAVAVQRALVGSMQATIQGYISFLGQKPNTEVQAAFTVASQQMTDYKDALLRMQGIEPTPLPTATPIIPTPTRDMTARPVEIDYHKEMVVYSEPHGVLQRTLNNPRKVTIFAQRKVDREPWYRVKVGNVEGWAMLYGLGTEVTDIVPVE